MGWRVEEGRDEVTRSDTRPVAECLGTFGDGEGAVILHIKTVTVNTIVRMLPKLQFSKALMNIYRNNWR